MTHVVCRAAGLVAVILATSGSAWAQTSGPALRPSRVTVAVGATWAGGYAIGDRAVTLRPNTTSGTPPFTLFDAAASFERATGVETRIGVTLTPALAVEIGGAYARPQIALVISGDAESGPQTLAGDAISQYVIDLSLVWQLPRIHIGSRGRPYLAAGGGYLRQLYAEGTRAETGQLYHLGGGVRYWLRGGDGTGRDLGLRAEVRANTRRGGIEFNGKSRNYPVATLSVFTGF